MHSNEEKVLVRLMFQVIFQEIVHLFLERWYKTTTDPEIEFPPVHLSDSTTDKLAMLWMASIYILGTIYYEKLVAAAYAPER